LDDTVEGASNDQKGVDRERRNFLKATVVASAALAIGGMAAVAKVADETGGDTTSTTGVLAFPRYLIQDSTTGQTANIKTLQTNQYLTFNYPLDNEPNFIMKLGVPAVNGVGPDGDIVAFSDTCQHLGCPPGFVYPGGPGPFCNTSYSGKRPVMYCCCHGSIYDVTNAAKVIGGPAPYPVPQVMLEVDAGTGDIYAVGMGPPTIYQHGTPGSTDVTADLQGGTLVGSSSSSSELSS
jgi:arsenite oxidase small subunit